MKKYCTEHIHATAHATASDQLYIAAFKLMISVFGVVVESLYYLVKMQFKSTVNAEHDNIIIH